MTPQSKALAPAEAYARLADRCATTELCTGEALDKLHRWGVASREAESIVQRLVTERFIDDERFARIWVRDRLWNARWGLLKIRAAMRLKRLEPETVEAAIGEEMDDERYFANLAAALRSKGRRMASPIAYEDKVKLARFAMSRGYEPELVREMLADESYWREEPDE